LANIKVRKEQDGEFFYDIKELFPRSSKHRIGKDKKNIWEVIKFGIEKKKASCFICDRQGTKENTVLFYPFERKVLNYFPWFNKSQRLNLCPLHQRVLFYSFGNIYYARSDDRVIIFFPSGVDYERIAEFSTFLKELAFERISAPEENHFANIRPERVSAYFPFEFLLPLLLEVFDLMERKQKDPVEILSEIRIELVSYLKGGLNIFDHYESISRIDELFRAFVCLKKKTKGLSSFIPFYNGLTVGFRERGKKLVDKNKIREDWAKVLLVKHRVDFVSLNKTVMENIKIYKDEYRFIPWYQPIITGLLEGLGMKNDKELFEKINALGWHLVADEARKTGGLGENQLKSFLWDIFRTRTSEDFISALVELQLKLQSNQREQPIDFKEVTDG